MIIRKFCTGLKPLRTTLSQTITPDIALEILPKWMKESNFLIHYDRHTVILLLKKFQGRFGQTQKPSFHFHIDHVQVSLSWKRQGEAIYHLMTDPKGNSEFCLAETLNVPQGEVKGIIQVVQKQNKLQMHQLDAGWHTIKVHVLITYEWKLQAFVSQKSSCFRVRELHVVWFQLTHDK